MKPMKLRIPRVIIGGTESGVGKTSVATGLMGALKTRGLRVQGFKAGPDFIDPSYHTTVTGRKSRNLDSWMMNLKVITEVFIRAALDADIAVIEGVMGLFDGVSGTDEVGSTAHVAKILRCPVILVVDASASARSVAATVLGFKQFDPDISVRGVILNRVSGEKHARWCREAVESVTGIRVLGAVTYNENLHLPERHLGLVPTQERPLNEGLLNELSATLSRSVNLDEVLRTARSAIPISLKRAPSSVKRHRVKVRIGVAHDEAFSFYYPENLELLAEQGAQICQFSPIHDSRLPEVEGLYIGGGFPEVYADQLTANSSIRTQIKRAIDDGIPVYAECGGLMYLTRSIRLDEGSAFPMVGALDATTLFSKKLRLAYTKAKVVRDNPLSSAGAVLKGHEFHYSAIVEIPKDAVFAYRMITGQGIMDCQDGWVSGNALASYSHMHFATNKKLAENFVSQCSNRLNH